MALFPRSHKVPAFSDPDLGRINRELVRMGTTLKQPHAEYRNETSTKFGILISSSNRQQLGNRDSKLFVI